MRTEDKPIDELGSFVAAQFERARNAKQPHFQTMCECNNLMHGRSLTPPDEKSPNIVMDVSSPIVKGVAGLIRDIFAGATAQPFDIRATPVAELPESVIAQLEEQLIQDFEVLAALSDGDPAVLRERMQESEQLLLLEQNRKAVTAAERMQEVIADRLFDADWEDNFIEFISNFCIYPSAVMKYPAVRYVTRKKWVNDTVVVEREAVRCVETISPFDFYPAPHASDVDSADFVIERRRLSRNEFLGLRNLAGYSADTISEIVEQNPNGATLAYSSDSDVEKDTYGDQPNVDAFDALGYYGAIRNDVLAEYGIEFAADEKYGTSEAEVWVVANRVIKCLLNPDAAGKRPFYTASFERIPGAFWGASPAMKLRDTQRVCTATVRSLVKNMRYSSGPIGEVRKGRVKDGHDPAAIIPNTIRVVSDDNMGGGSRAYDFYTVPSLTGELTALFEKFVSYGYELIGIPRLAFGGTQGVGTVGRTSGGLSIVVNQSTKTIKHALRSLERSLIEPVIQGFVDYELYNSTDQSIKGDVRVHARGVSGLMEREQQNDNLEWALQSVSSLASVIDPMTNQPIIPATAIQRILYQLFKNKGLPTHGVFPDFDRQEVLGELGLPMPNSPEQQLPQLDGRSPDAAAAIDAANGGLVQ